MRLILLLPARAGGRFVQLARAPPGGQGGGDRWSRNTGHSLCTRAGNQSSPSIQSVVWRSTQTCTVGVLAAGPSRAGRASIFPSIHTEPLDLYLHGGQQLIVLDAVRKPVRRRDSPDPPRLLSTWRYLYVAYRAHSRYRPPCRWTGTGAPEGRRDRTIGWEPMASYAPACCSG